MSTDAPQRKPLTALDVAACCSDIYSHPAARWLMGDSFHPGGLALTERVAALAGITPSARVLDAGSGRGTSAAHLAETIGCHVVGLTLEEAGVEAGRALAEAHGVADRVRFIRADVQTAALEPASFDAALLECVLSILPDKPASLERIADALKPGARLGLTDVTVSGAIPRSTLAR